jgi:sugar lactone lactonase YvrE
VETLVEEVAGTKMVFCDNAAVASDGTIYFSDSSTVHPIARWQADMVEDTRTGRLLRRIPVGQGPHGLCIYPQPGRYSLGHTGVFR